MTQDRRRLYALSFAIFAVLLLAWFFSYELTRAVSAVLLPVCTVLVWLFIKKRSVLSIHKYSVLMILAMAALLYLAILYLSGAYFGYPLTECETVFLERFPDCCQRRLYRAYETSSHGAVGKGVLRPRLCDRRCERPVFRCGIFRAYHLPAAYEYARNDTFAGTFGERALLLCGNALRCASQPRVPQLDYGGAEPCTRGIGDARRALVSGPFMSIESAMRDHALNGSLASLRSLPWFS